MASRRARFDVNLIRDYVGARADQILDDAADDMREIVKDGAEQMQTIIDTSVTETGRRRVENGGQYAGRRETDEMYQDVKFDVERGKDEVVGRFGWIDDWQDYYGLQNDGTQFVEGMDALGQSFARAEDRLRSYVGGIR